MFQVNTEHKIYVRLSTKYKNNADCSLVWL